MMIYCTTSHAHKVMVGNVLNVVTRVEYLFPAHDYHPPTPAPLFSSGDHVLPFSDFSGDGTELEDASSSGGPVGTVSGKDSASE